MVVKRLGKNSVKHDLRNLLAADYLEPGVFPEAYDWQKHRAPMPARTFGNDSYGDCTLASQANALARLERIEQRRTILLADQLVIQNYLEMTGGADDGWYELEALKRWRTTGFSPRVDRPYTIDAFTQIHTTNVDEMKAAIWQFKVIKMCFQLPIAWSSIEPEGYAPPGTMTGLWTTGTGSDYDEGSWGGHSMSVDGYNPVGAWAIHSWYVGAKPARQLVTWDAIQKYADEAYSIVDSFDAWRKRKPVFDLKALKADVAEVTAS